MGNAQSQNLPSRTQNSNVNKGVHKADDAQLNDLIQRINKLSRGLYHMYGLNFNSNRFCKQIALSYEKKLGELPLYQLKNIHQKQNSENKQPAQEKRAMKAFLAYEPNPHEKFLANEIKDNLIDFFNSKIDFKTVDEVNTSVEGIGYINPKTKSTLQGRQFKNKKNQRGGQNEINKLLMNMGEPQRAPRPNNNSANNAINNSNNNSGNKINNKGSNRGTYRRNNRKNNRRENKRPEKKKTYLNEIANIENLIDKKPSNNKTTNEVNKEIKKEFANINRKENEIEKNIDNREKQINKLPNNRATVNNEIKNKPINVNQHLSCPEDGECYLTKQELCERISKHYTYRGNIIAAILSAIPHHKDGKLVGSFCYSRYEALKNGRLCLPRGIENLENMPLQDKLRELSRFVNNTEDYQCKSANGYYKVLNPTEKQALVTNDNKFNRYYVLYTAKLYNQYLDALQKLLGVLDVLENSTTINNQQLNEIGKQTKDILDGMYSMCQFNYLSALLAYLRADLDLGQRNKKAKDREVQELETGLAI